jgi:hypothetical protein
MPLTKGKSKRALSKAPSQLTAQQSSAPPSPLSPNKLGSPAKKGGGKKGAKSAASKARAGLPLSSSRGERFRAPGSGNGTHTHKSRGRGERDPGMWPVGRANESHVAAPGLGGIAEDEQGSSRNLAPASELEVAANADAVVAADLVRHALHSVLEPPESYDAANL